ncbi:MAG: hypothetical protein PWQ27_18 [Kosmotoga sp.]|nr:hypothetical protein [Kosmotoga sp.]
MGSVPVELIERIEELGNEIGLQLRLVDSQGNSLGNPLPVEIPPLVLALSLQTGSRSSTTSGLETITAMPVNIGGNALVLVVIGEFREDNAFRLLKVVTERMLTK